MDQTQIPAGTEAHPEHDRKFERVGDTLLVSYSTSEEFAPEFTETYDIAIGGMAIITNAEINSGATVIIQLEYAATRTRQFGSMGPCAGHASIRCFASIAPASVLWT